MAPGHPDTCASALLPPLISAKSPPQVLYFAKLPQPRPPCQVNKKNLGGRQDGPSELRSLPECDRSPRRVVAAWPLKTAGATLRPIPVRHGLKRHERAEAGGSVAGCRPPRCRSVRVLARWYV